MYGITIIGNLTNIPELRFTKANKPVVSFSIAVNRKVNGEEQTDFHRCTAFGDMAERMAQLDKGTRVVVYGRLSSRSWEDETGKKNYITELVADDVAPSMRWAEVTVSRIPRTGSAYQEAPRAQQPSSLDDVRDQIANAKQAARAGKQSPPPAEEDFNWSTEPF